VGAALLAYPAGLLDRREERIWVVAATAWLLSGRLVLGLFPPSTRTAGWWPELFPSSTVRSALEAVFDAGALLIVIWFATLLFRRWRRTPTLDRLVDAPVLVASLAIGVSAGAHVVAFLMGGVSRGRWPAIAQDLALAALPLSFLAVALVRQLLYASVATALGNLPTASTPADVRRALALALRDPGLDVLYWLPDAGDYVDSRGIPASAESLPQRLDIVCRTADGTPLAIIRLNASTHRHPELLASALRLGTLALENSRLQAALLAQLHEVEQSRARIVAATLESRRQLERDLHDGAQQRLLALAATLGRLHRQASDPGLRAVAEEARADLRAALRELRDLAHGIHPASLSEGGLRRAVAAAAEGLPLEVELAIPDRRWPADVETTAYFVICEGLTNAAKHARSATARISVTGDEKALTLMISDDGVGGASLDGGSGLRGLQDRVNALGGRLTMTSSQTAGTRIQVTMPCA
jgi:signal transduction histidine kinase